MFGEIGYTLAVLEPGKPTGMYHAESLRRISSSSRASAWRSSRSRSGDCGSSTSSTVPPGTRHVFVGAGDSPCVLLMIGNRVGEGGIVYPRSEVALERGAGVEQETGPRRARRTRRSGTGRPAGRSRSSKPEV